MNEETKKREILPEEIMHFGLDHLEAYGTFARMDLLDGVDLDNSNVATWEQFTLCRHEVPKYRRKIVFTAQDLPCFAWYEAPPKAQENGIRLKNYVCAYAAAFRLFGEAEVLRVVREGFEPSRIRRFDVCLDLRGWEVRDVQSRLFAKIPTAWSDINGRGGPETLYLGTFKRSVNKLSLVRIYDKIKDVRKKGKHLLYPEYAASDEPIARVEVEFRSSLCRQVELGRLLDHDYLLSLFKHPVSRYTNLFIEALPGTPESLFLKRPKVSPEEIQSKAERDSRVRMCIGHMRGIWRLGVCPVELAIYLRLYREETKRALGQEAVEEMRKRASVSRHWYRKVLNALARPRHA